MSDSTHNRAENAPVSLSSPPEGYSDWLGELKTQIHEAQQRAAQALNLELVLLYWQIGKAILARQDQQGWGVKVVDRLAHDLRASFPEIQGFSVRNLKYIRAFAQCWPDIQFVQQLLHKLPWGHKLVLLNKLNTEQERRWKQRRDFLFDVLTGSSVFSAEDSLFAHLGKHEIFTPPKTWPPMTASELVALEGD